MKYHSTQSGFSLVEVLVAITILLLVVTGPMAIISRSNSSTAFATEQVNAFFLAQEGLELAQKGRDDLLLRYMQRQINGTGGITNPMATFLTTYSSCFTSTGCGLVIGSALPAAVSVNSCSGGNCQLYLDTSTSVRPSYVHTVTANLTPYTRTIIMQRLPASGTVEEIKVTSRVTWRTGSLLAGQQVELITYLANVYDAN